MMFKLSIVSAILVLSIAAGLTVYAVLSVPEEKPVASTEPEMEIITEPVAEPIALSLADVDESTVYVGEKAMTNENAAQAKICTIEGRTASIAYAQSIIKNNGQPIDVFKDEYENEYKYDAEGRLVGYRNKGYDNMYVSSRLRAGVLQRRLARRRPLLLLIRPGNICLANDLILLNWKM
ncbi:MAG: hypothetical protein HFE77_02095 [Clostridiales bacterium]|nr:hypothetical protein [Clostridiales bacterium]